MHRIVLKQGYDTADCLNHTQSIAAKLGNEDLLTNPSEKCCSSTFLGHNL